MKWYEVKSAEELKTLGTLKSVKQQINKDIKEITNIKELSTFIRMGSNSWNGQFAKIENLKKIIYLVSEKGDILRDTNQYSNDGYFKSDSHRYIFYLLELEGQARMKKLKISKLHYNNNEVAKKWYTEIAKKVHPDVCKHEGAARAMAELVSIYNNMVKNE
ncbi:hypothetical protein [Clostridium sp. C8-1-8]|uniref:hypothetical protein n=1 Tax=Clostridium sp. C8-1-8 TaxID=2698831 RepID=UPI0013711BF1|nr:hypothetical protein [Clostridium sp. C8-1-8]